MVDPVRKPYNPSDWYWFVGGDLTRAFSSAVGDYVSLSNPAFLVWSADGTAPTSIDTETSLGSVLAAAGIRPVNVNVLDGYASTAADGVIAMVTFRVLFNHENRLRAVERNLGLNGSPPNLTPAQARAAVKALM